MSSCHHVIMSSCHFDNFWSCLATFANFSNFQQYLPTFVIFLELFATFINSCQCLTTFSNIWLYLAIFWYIQKLLKSISKVWQLLPTFGTSAIFDNLATFGNFWQLLSSYSCHFWQFLATFFILSLSHPVILSYCHFVILSFFHLVGLAACQYDKLWGLPRRVFTLFLLANVNYSHCESQLKDFVRTLILFQFQHWIIIYTLHRDLFVPNFCTFGHFLLFKHDHMPCITQISIFCSKSQTSLW